MYLIELWYSPIFIQLYRVDKKLEQAIFSKALILASNLIFA